MNISEHRIAELRRLAAVESAAWKRLDRLSRSSPVAPGLLAKILDCIAQRRRLLGLDAPERGELEVTGDLDIQTPLTDDSRHTTRAH